MFSDHRLTEVLPISGYLRHFNPARWFMLSMVLTHEVGWACVVARCDIVYCEYSIPNFQPCATAIFDCDVRGNQMECENFLMGS